MQFFRSRRFEKRFKRLSRSFQERAVEWQLLFASDPGHPLLDDHALHDPYLGCRSFSVTGDMRIIYRLISETDCLLVDIGTHHELYGS